MRVVSLLPAATEIVCALGAEAELVGVSHECDHPRGLMMRGVPALTRARIDLGGLGGSSLEIDRAVRRAAADALGIYLVDVELLSRVRPELIVTQDLCEVCAVSLDDVKSAVSRWVGRERVEIVSLHPTRLGDVLDDVERVGAALGRNREAAALRASMSARFAAIRERAQQASGRPRCATLEWLEPMMLGGTWMPELVELAGGVALGAAPGTPAPTLTPSELVALRPEVVLIKPCGFSLERALSELSIIERDVLGPLGGSARVYVTDGNAFFNRSGPRLVESLEILAACLHPELFRDFAEAHTEALRRL
jgi:iron complex transport system substrate-binding protein